MFFRKKNHGNIDSGLNENGSVLLAKDLLYSGAYKIDFDAIADAMGDRFQLKSVDEQIATVAEVRLCILSLFMILIRVPRHGILVELADLIEKTLFEELSEVHLVTPGDLVEFQRRGLEFSESLVHYTDRLECRRLMSNRYWEYSDILKDPLVRQDATVMGLALQQAGKKCGLEAFGDYPGLDFILFVGGLLSERVQFFHAQLLQVISIQKPV